MLGGLFSVLVAFVLAGIGTYLGIHWAPRWGLVDEANHRSLHSGSKPRSGGLGLLFGVAAGWLLAGLLGYLPAQWWALSLAAGAVATVSLFDDLRDTPAFARVIVHLAAAMTLLFTGFGLGMLEVPGVSIQLNAIASAGLTLLFVVWFINLYNFMDGMDGFAGGMTMFGFAAYAVLGAQHTDVGFAVAAAVVAVASGAFLLFNFPPARVFMGDVGSATLGFLAAAFILWADAAQIAPLWIGVMIFSPFFLDATVTVSRRTLSGQRFWQPHRSHYYQRAVGLGWSHRKTVLVEYALMLGCAITALLIIDSAVWVQWAAILSWLGVYFICASAISTQTS